MTAEGVADAFLDPNVLNKYGRFKDECASIFYYGTVIENNFKYSVFASSPILAKIEGMAVRHFHVDATFKVVPFGEFRQLLVIHINVDEHTFPLIYVLMTRKTQEAYCSVFQYIEENVCHLRPNSFMTDYETGLRNALRFVYTIAKIEGCWFHYCQVIKKNARRFPVFYRSYKLNQLQRNCTTNSWHCLWFAWI